MGIETIDGARAVFSDAFQLPGTKIHPKLPDLANGDRLIMAARPGMLRKLLPLREDDTGVYSGGCYLFDTFENAEAFADWVANDFTTGGVQFLDRPQFMDVAWNLWHVVGASDFADVTQDQELMRFERWHLLAPADLEEIRRDWWPKIREKAESEGSTAVWLLLGADEIHRQLSLLTVRQRPDVENRGETRPDLSEFERRTSLGTEVAAAYEGTKVFDRTSWVYMVWHPIAEGDTSPEAVQWPSSPPLPGI